MGAAPRSPATPQPPCLANSHPSAHPDPGGSLTLSCGPDFLSKVTLGATGAQWPIKPIDAERETVKQVTPSTEGVCSALPTLLGA